MSPDPFLAAVDDVIRLERRHKAIVKLYKAHEGCGHELFAISQALRARIAHAAFLATHRFVGPVIVPIERSQDVRQETPH